MTPEEFLESFVEGNRFDCHGDPGCVRRAFNAAISASHLADQFHSFNKRHNPALVANFQNIGSYVEYLTKRTNGAFRDIRSIANAYTHLYTDLGSPFGAHSTVDSSGCIQSMDLSASVDFAQVRENHGTDGPSVVFTRRDGTTLVFLSILDVVVDNWRAEIYGSANNPSKPSASA